MKIAVFGAGYLGRRLSRDLGADILYVDALDPSVEHLLRSGKYDAVVNAAGKTGRPNVDWCEGHREETFRSNVEAPLALARACRAAGAHLLHLGSGCIFYGPSAHPDGAWREGDFANPVSYYSKTKYAADLALQDLPGVAVVRLRMPLDGVPDGRNLLTKLISYAQVADVRNSITVVDDLVVVVRRLLALRVEGVFHAVNPGAVRHGEILALYRRIIDPSHVFETIGEDDLERLGLVAKRRSSVVLASERLGAHGVWMRPVGEALRDALAKYAAHVKRGAR